jgi:hypothetical protein
MYKKTWGYYTIGGPHEKIFKNFFLEITPLGVKTCGESDFDIFEVTKRFPDPGKTCVLKRKVAKIAFLRFFALIHRPSLMREAFFSFENVKLGFSVMFLSLAESFPEKNLKNFFT